MGTKKLYNEEVHTRMVNRLAALGMIDAEIYEILGISMVSYYAWIKKFPKFKAAILEGRENPVKKVRDSLIKRALGYEYEEKTLIPESQLRDKKTGKLVRGRGRPMKIKYVCTEKKIKHMPPDIAAIKMALVNLDKETKWVDRNELNINGNLTFRVIPADIPEDKKK